MTTGADGRTALGCVTLQIHTLGLRDLRMSMHKDLLSQSVGERLRAACRNNNLSQEEIGKLIGTSKQQIFKYEKAVDTPSLSRLVQLAETLNMPLVFFLEGYATSRDISNTADSDVQNILLYAYGVLNQHDRVLLLSIAEALVECSGRVNGPPKTRRSLGEIPGSAINM